jgi:hypothetical protein
VNILYCMYAIKYVCVQCICPCPIFRISLWYDLFSQNRCYDSFLIVLYCNEDKFVKCLWTLKIISLRSLDLMAPLGVRAKLSSYTNYMVAEMGFHGFSMVCMAVHVQSVISWNVWVKMGEGRWLMHPRLVLLPFLSPSGTHWFSEMWLRITISLEQN